MTARGDSRPPSLRLRGAITRRIAASTSITARLGARAYGVRPLLGKPAPLELYYEPGDPHSHLCAQLLPALQARLRSEIRIYIVGEPAAPLYPEAGKQRQFALQDAIRVAPAYGLQFPENAQLPDSRARPAAATALLEYSGSSRVQAFVRREREVVAALWAGQTAEPRRDATADPRLLRANRRRHKLGHYLPGMWQFDGEWFWGVDRLQHLAQRLRARNLLDGDAPIAPFDASGARLPLLDQPPPALEFFFSFRSPYSYLAAVQMCALQPRLGVDLNIRPVLPMVMRGLKVPVAKRLYIVRDVYREARDLGIAFGRIADPVGAGAQRCLTLFPLAGDTARQLAFIQSASEAVWSQAVDVASERGLRHVCARAGLDWAQARERLLMGPSLDYAEANRQALFAAGFWGVPSFRLGNFGTWGRDRLWLVEELLRRSGALTDPQ